MYLADLQAIWLMGLWYFIFTMKTISVEQLANSLKGLLFENHLPYFANAQH